MRQNIDVLHLHLMLLDVVYCLSEDENTEMLHDVTLLLLSRYLMEAKFYRIKLLNFLMR